MRGSGELRGKGREEVRKLEEWRRGSGGKWGSEREEVRKLEEWRRGSGGKWGSEREVREEVRKLEEWRRGGGEDCGMGPPPPSMVRIERSDSSIDPAPSSHTHRPQHLQSHTTTPPSYQLITLPNNTNS